MEITPVWNLAFATREKGIERELKFFYSREREREGDSRDEYARLDERSKEEGSVVEIMPVWNSEFATSREGMSRESNRTKLECRM